MANLKAKIVTCPRCAKKTLLIATMDNSVNVTQYCSECGYKKEIIFGKSSKR